MKEKKKYLGEILIRKGLITEDDLQDAIEEQLRNKKFIGRILVEKGMIAEDDLFATLAEQFDIDLVRFKDIEIDWEVVFEFPSALIVSHKCFPISGDETLTLAITNPLDVWTVNDVEREVAPRKVKVVLITMPDMDEAVKEYRRRSVQKIMKKWKKD